MIDKETILKKIIYGPDGKSPLSPDQRKAVESESRHVRILAGAGAGKTETLTRRILYLLLYKDVDPEKIVAFTFTEKAAQSMKSRIYRRVTEIVGEEHTAKLGKMYIGTIHGYALRVLQDHFGKADYEVLDENQEMAFIMRRGWEIGINGFRGRNYGEKCKNFLDAVNVVYNELIPRNKLEEKNPYFHNVLQRYEEKLDEYRRFTFGRLIYMAVKYLEEHPEKLSDIGIEHLIVDEYQDINRAQEELIKLLGKNAHVMVVGDPRQTIYQWRGSDDECFERFATEIYPDAEKITIPENRRSGKKIVEISNTVADNFESREYEHVNPLRDADGYVYVVVAEDPDEEAKWIVDQIEDLVKKGLKYSDFGILLRSVSTSGEPFIKELKKRGIPYSVGGKAGLFRREEATAVGKLFVWLYDDGYWREGGREIRDVDLLESALGDWDDVTGLVSKYGRETIEKELYAWKANIYANKYHNFQEAYHDLLNALRYKDLDPSNKLHAAIMANLGRFSNLLGDYENAIRLGGNKFRWNKTTLKGLFWYINFYATTAYEEQPGEDIRGTEEMVQLTTIHQAKGLEWTVVFVPSLIMGRFPTRNIDRKKTWLISRELFPADKYDTKEDDERRLFYVAVTRARSTLVLSTFRKMKRSASISKFLEEVLRENPKTIDALSTKTDKPIEVDRSLIKSGEEELTTFDAAEIVDYTKCPYFYRMRHVWNYDAPLAEELGYGRSLHYCLRRAVEYSNEEGYNPFSAIITAVDEGFYLPYAPPEKAKKMREGAKKMLMNYVADHLQDIRSVAEKEYRIEFPRKNSTITGKVDVIINKDGGYEVREYKTSRKVTKPEQAALQVQLYAIGLKEYGFNVKEGSVAYLGEGELDKVEVRDDILRKVRDEAEKILSKICGRNYEPKPGEFCQTCDFRNICKWVKKEVLHEIIHKSRRYEKS